MIKTTKDIIEEAIERKFAEEKIDSMEFSKNITSFNETATKAMVIYDNCDSIGRVFILIGLHATVDKSWKVTYFKNSSEGTNIFDALDAMCDADTWLNY